MMGSQSIKHAVEKHEEEKVPDPHEFASLTLKRMEAMHDGVVEESSNGLEISSQPNPSVALDIGSIKRSLKLGHKPWIVDDQVQGEGESDTKQPKMHLSPEVCLPKGVTRGCSECSDCQKVSARWVPDGACNYSLEDAPVFHPGHEEFTDILKYIDSIRQQVEPYGFCRIVPPTSWKSPCFLEEEGVWQSFTFNTHVQRVNDLQGPFSAKAPTDDGLREAKRRRVGGEYNGGSAANFWSGESHGTESLQIKSGPDFTLIGFKRQADYFKNQYFSSDSVISNGKTSPAVHQELSEDIIEGEYWRIFEKPTEEIEVLYGTGTLGSISPLSSSTSIESASVKHSGSDWILNCISSVPGSLLSFGALDSSCILVPQLHIGMCFTSMPWNVEEHSLFKLDYLHMGAPRIWYGISGHDAETFENFTKKHLVDFSEHTNPIKKMGRQLSPGTLKMNCIPVYRSIQRPGEFMLFLPRSYHSRIDCGFNCSSSAVFAPLCWLPHGLTSVELYRERKWRTLISYDRLLLRAANEVLKARWEDILKRDKNPTIRMWKDASGKDGIVTKALRARIRSEATCRDYISPASQSRKMDESFDIGGRKECCICSFDLYLSAVTCPCNLNKFSCLNHAKHLCSCAWTDKKFLFRYEIKDLDILAEAVGGKITSLRIWYRMELSSALQLDKPNQGRIGLAVDPPPVAEVSGRAPSHEINQSSGSMSPSDAAEAPSGDQFSEDVKAKAMEFVLKYASNDSSSSSSDWDIDACIAELESRKTETLPGASGKTRDLMPAKTVNKDTKAVSDAASKDSSDSISLNHFLNLDDK